MKLSVLYGTQTLLLSLQIPTTCLYQEPDESSPYTCPPSYFFKIHFNLLIFHICLGLPIYLFSCPHQNPVSFCSPVMHCIPQPFHPTWLYHANNVCGGVQILSIPLCIFLHPTATYSLLDPNYFSTTFSTTLSLMFIL
jgi:hypothetical protein